MNITVVGLGKIGLPLAVQFASRDHRVIGADTNAAVVEQVNRGVAPFPGEAHLADRLASVVASGRLTATGDTTSAVAESEVVVVVVPLFVNADSEPDFRWMDAATRDIGLGLRQGTLVSFETTLPVGTTRGRWKPLLEQESSLAEGTDFHVVFSPERVLTGRVFEDLRRYPKIVGGLSVEGTERARAFYEEVLEFDVRPELQQGNGVWSLGSAEAAEMAKLAETTYRDVNIGLANQFAQFAAQHGVDIHRVIDACNSQPYSHIHRPGIAVGGHCIPVYPQLYLWGDPRASVVRSAREANANMPHYVVEELGRIYGDLSGARVVVLGASYRGGVKETAFSGVFPTVANLLAKGAGVTVHDPMHTGEELRALGLDPHVLGSAVDVAILQAHHAQYDALTAADFPGVSLIVDGRGELKPTQFPGVPMYVIGRPSFSPCYSL